MKKTKLIVLTSILLMMVYLVTGCIGGQYGIIIENYNNGSMVKGKLKSADDETLILYPVDAEVVNIYLATVKKINFKGETIDAVDKYGIVKNVKIKKDEEIEIPMNKIKWVEASWKVDENYKTDFENRIFKADKNADKFVLPFYVRDPFQVGNTPESYDDFIIGINGSRISLGENPHGWRSFEMWAKNNQPGKRHSETYSFYPYLKGKKVGLPDKRYVIMPKYEFTVKWE